MFFEKGVNCFTILCHIEDFESWQTIDMTSERTDLFAVMSVFSGMNQKIKLYLISVYAAVQFHDSALCTTKIRGAKHM